MISSFNHLSSPAGRRWFHWRSLPLRPFCPDWVPEETHQLARRKKKKKTNKTYDHFNLWSLPTVVWFCRREEQDLKDVIRTYQLRPILFLIDLLHRCENIFSLFHTVAKTATSGNPTHTSFSTTDSGADLLFLSVALFMSIVTMTKKKYNFWLQTSAGTIIDLTAWKHCKKKRWLEELNLHLDEANTAG